MSEKELIVATVDDDGILSVLINRADKRNALSSAVQEALLTALEGHGGNPSIKLAILRGAGTKAFAAGGDLDELDAIRTLDAAHAMAESGKRVLNAVRYFPAPVIARLNGVALGGGAELACACDMRFADSHARLGFVQANLAISTAWGGAYDLFRLVGPATALQLLCRAEVLSPAEAFRFGLVSAYTGEGEDDEQAFQAFIAPFRQKEASVLRGYKQLRLAAEEGRREEWDRRESDLLARAWVSDEHWQAVKAAREKKPT